MLLQKEILKVTEGGPNSSTNVDYIYIYLKVSA